MAYDLGKSTISSPNRFCDGRVWTGIMALMIIRGISTCKPISLLHWGAKCGLHVCIGYSEEDEIPP